MYQRVSCFQNFLNFLAANGFSIGGKQPPSTVGHQVDHRQIGCRVALTTRSRLDRGANHSLDSQSPQVCSTCLSELGAVCARLVSQTANIPKRSDAVSGGHSDRARSSTSTRPGGPANVECGDFWGMAGQQSLASASGGDAAAHFRYANVARDEHLNENEFARLQPGPGAGVEMVEGSLALTNWRSATCQP